MKISRTLPLLCFLLLIVSGRLQGQLELPEIRQITTHPSPDFSPAVSPDGKWLAFTSERSGNLDIWVKRLPHDPPVQVTSHLGDDLLPVWSPDSKRLAFISKRRDARGDIWLLTLNLKKGGIPKGKPVQLTNYLGLDTHPSFSPDGKEIVFESDRDGQTNLWIMNIPLKEVRRLTTYGGACPSWSPSGPWVLFISHRFENGGDIFIIDSNNPEQKESQRRTVNPVTWGSALDRQPAWAPNGRQMVFIRHYTDTDGDGKITPHDNGSIWQKTLVEKGEVSPRNIIIGQGEIQITIDIFQDSKPYWSSQNIIFF